MASVGDLTRDEETVARRMFGVRMIHALAWTFEAERSSAIAGGFGCSGLRLPDGREGWGATTSKGVGWHSDIRGIHSKQQEFEVFITWPRLAGHLRAHRTPQLVADCKAHVRASRDHHAGSKTYPGRWRGVPFAVPLNPHGMTHEDVQDWWETVHMPEYRALCAAEAALLDRIYPATAADPEPVDLLELLSMESPA